MRQDPPTIPPPRQWATANSGHTVQVGGPNYAPINISHRLKLPIHPVPRADREAATTPLWAHTPTPQRIADHLANQPLAVIVGQDGTGRRTSALRALHTRLTDLNQTPQLFDLAADWDDEEVPEHDTLPELAHGHGYLIDITARTVSPAAVLALTSWAEQLHEAGGALVITGNPHDWKGNPSLEIPAIRPDALQVAHNHLTTRLHSATHAHWLQPDPPPAPRGGLLRGPAAPDPTAGVLADLITRSVSPTDAIAIAERIRDIDPDRLARAVEQRNDTQPPGSQDRPELTAIRDQVLLWQGFLEKTLTETGTRGPDRVMLLSAAYLETAPLELCIKAASQFGPSHEQSARRYREGRSPRRRMRAVGVDVTQDDRAGFDSRPGLALAAIRTDWHHWADERTETKLWLEKITAPDGVAKDWAGQIGHRILDLSRTAVDPPFFDVLDTWTAASANPPEPARIRLVAELLTHAAQTDELTKKTHKKLLDWVTKKTTPHRREAVARVCAGPYGQRWPHISLVRLRHILAHDDDAARIAAAALATHAAASSEGLTRIVNTIESWMENHPDHSAGPRAFLALTNPTQPENSADRLITLAQVEPDLRDFLVTGWWATLKQVDVRENAHQTLLAWAQAVHEEQLDRDVTFSILTEVRNAHIPLDAMSRFLYGHPDHEDPALIEARSALANLRVCNHTPCTQPNCPLTQQPTEPPDTSTTDGTHERQQ